MVMVERDGGYLIFKRDGTEFYDRQIPSESEFELFMRDMSEKNWFADALSDVTFLIAEYWGQS